MLIVEKNIPEREMFLAEMLSNQTRNEPVNICIELCSKHKIYQKMKKESYNWIYSRKLLVLNSKKL